MIAIYSHLVSYIVLHHLRDLSRSMWLLLFLSNALWATGFAFSWWTLYHNVVFSML
uniref:Uncharacterized protein n=1 Tax=Octopus bimaculoides TaxID=37653 RepID=A0A0L8GVN3_OCTBM